MILSVLSFIYTMKMQYEPRSWKESLIETIPQLFFFFLHLILNTPFHQTMDVIWTAPNVEKDAAKITHFSVILAPVFILKPRLPTMTKRQMQFERV